MARFRFARAEEDFVLRVQKKKTRGNAGANSPKRSGQK